MNALLPMLHPLQSLHFLRPWWLLALALLPLLAWRWRQQARRRGRWHESVDAHLLQHLLVEAGPRQRQAWRAALGLLGLLLMVLALSGPSVRKDLLPAWQSQRPLVLALDLSRASLARDLPPSRLVQARAKLAALLRLRGDGQVALLAFAEDAYTVAPLTADPANVAIFLDALSPEVMPADGARADRAIARARQLLQQAGFSRGDILLLTDHADAAAIAAAAQARAAGYRVSALGVGTAQGGVYDSGSGLRRAQLDAASLRTLAASGGGNYQALQAGQADLRALGVLDPRPGDAGLAGAGTLAHWRDDGYWLLPLALVCLLPLYRRGGGLALLLACVLWQPMLPAQARQQAAPPPHGTLWQRKDQAAYAQMQAGIAAYRRKQYAQAIAQFAPLADAQGQYNLGNALAQAGRYDEAIAAYARALAQQPGMADARYNKALVEAARKRQPPAPQHRQQNQKRGDGQGRNPQGKGQQGQQDAQPAQGAPEGSQAGPREQRQPAQPGRSQASPPAASGKPTSPEQQAQADAAQRQRMRDALRQQPGAAKPETAAQTRAQQETPAQRERRLANQAWLQRVPDDPGALLRARFQLEAQRRREEGGR